MTTNRILLTSTLLFLTTIVAQGSQNFSSPPESREQRLTTLSVGLDKSLKDTAKKLEEKTPVTTRDLSNGALALLQHSTKAQAEAWLTLVLQSQNIDKTSPDYGAIPWQIGSDKVKDENAIEFATESWGPILLHYKELLSPEFESTLRAHIPAAIAALRRHTSDENSKKVEPSYTNIYLMNSTNLLLLGTAIHDAQAVQTAVAQFHTWSAAYSQSGIHEYDSPTYYSQDLTALSLAYANTQDPALRKLLKRGLDFFWTDIAANFFAGRMSISGPHSRDYDFLRGRGGALLYLWVEGLTDRQNTTKIDIEKAELIEALSGSTAYHPSDSILKITKIPERWVSSTWNKPSTTSDATEAGDRWNYITPNFAMGSTSADYGPQDKSITWELKSNPDEAVISLIPDVTDNPYGKNKFEGKDGHSKPRHVPLHPTTVQDKGALLVMLDLNPDREEETASLATNLILPHGLDTVLWDGKKLRLEDLTQTHETPGEVGSVLAIRQGQACVGFRIFEASGADGHSPQIVLKTDANGLREHVSRLAIYHYQGKLSKLESKHTRVGIASLARNCTDDADLKRLADQLSSSEIRSELSRDLSLHDQIWSVSLRLPGHPVLSAVRNMTERKTIDRKSGGHAVKAGLLTVNGKNLASDSSSHK